MQVYSWLHDTHTALDIGPLMASKTQLMRQYQPTLSVSFSCVCAVRMDKHVAGIMYVQYSQLGTYSAPVYASTFLSGKKLIPCWIKS